MDFSTAAKLGGKATVKPGIFHVFRPDRIEYVVKGTETAEQLESMVERGLTLVRVERADTMEMNLEK